jgi:heterodisulfide reductase subunit B
MSSSSNRVMMLEMSMKIIKKAEDSGVDALATNCLFCYNNLNMARKQIRTSIKVEHLLMLTTGCLAT